MSEEEMKGSSQVRPTADARTAQEPPSLTLAVARDICAHSMSGFCNDVGYSLGCKNGRGQSPTGAACVANIVQLSMSGYEEAAQAAIATMRSRSR